MRGRTILSTAVVSVAVIVCAGLVIGVSDSIKPREVAQTSPLTSGASSAPGSKHPSAGPTWPTWTEPAAIGPTDSNGPTDSAGTAATPSTSAAPASTAAAAPRVAAPVPTTSARTAAPAPAAPITGQSLPLGYSTGSATQVITVVAGSSSSTTGTLQAWDRAPGGGWLKHGAAITAHLGSDGLTAHASESLSATPVGSFALSRAFGALANPGTALSYHKTTSADWWISQPGSLYNTMQTCSGSCPFTQGDPNEHLYYETPYYNYAVVIEYNTGPIVAGAGSAFFLHVTDGTATAGCVAIPQTNLSSIMQWLNPASVPRILIGVG